MPEPTSTRISRREPLTGSRGLDAVLPAGAVAVALALFGQAPLWVFLLAALGLVALAAVLGEATRDLASRLGTLGAGILQATLGNASELILGIVALRSGLIEVVKASLTGSIISNLLLVLGLALFIGGLGRERQRVDSTVTRVNTTMLLIAAVGLIVPAVSSLAVPASMEVAAQPLERLSLWTAMILIVVYIAGVMYQFRVAPRVPRRPPQELARPLITLLLAVAGIAVLSELLVRELQTAQRTFHGTDLFWGGVIFALIGNAAENGVAVAAARRDDVNLAMAIGVGSSLQIALLIAPLLVFWSVAIGHPMSLVFSAIEIVGVVLSVVMVALIVGDGETNWLEGAQLIAVYAILAAAFYFLP